MAKKKTTIYIEEDLLRATKIAAAREGKPHYQVVEEALRKHLGFDVLERVRARSDLSSEQAMDLAYAELEKVRRERAKRKRDATR